MDSAEAAEAALSRWFSREYQAANPAQIAALRQTLAQNDPQGYLTTYELFATQDMYRADDLASIQVPTLVATGELDPGSTPEMAEQLAGRIPGAKVAVPGEHRNRMPVEPPPLVRQLAVVYPKERFHSRLVEGFVQFAKQRLSAMQAADRPGIRAA